MVALRCPQCEGSPSLEDHTCQCDACAATFRTLRGIPDLRLADDEYLPNADDWTIAERLDRDYDRLDFRGLLELYYRTVGDVPPDRAARQVAHILAAPGRARQWIAGLGLDRPGLISAPILDLGCGPGGFLAAVVQGGGLGDRPLWGLDIAMRWLLLARKRLDELGASNVRLVCAGAETMPFRPATFGGIVAGDAIEHVADASAVLAESHRVLVPGGRIVLATPNRYSLAPEPHVGLWGVGFLPRAWMPGYVRRLSGQDFRAIHTRSARDWRRLLNTGPFGGGDVIPPPLPPEELAYFGHLKRLAGRGYNLAVSTPIGRAAALAVGPMLHLLAERPADRGSSPAIPRGSTPSRSR